MIAYDVQFSEPTEPREDNALIRAVQRADGVVLSTTEVDEHGEGNVFGGEGVAEQIGARAGNTRGPVDPDGVLRRLSARLRRPRRLPRRRGRGRDRAAGRPRRGRRTTNRGSTSAARPGRSSPTPSPRCCAAGCPTTPSAARRRRRRDGALAAGLRTPHSTRAKAMKCPAPKCWPTRSGPSRGFPLQPVPGGLDLALIVLLGLLGPSRSCACALWPPLASRSCPGCSSSSSPSSPSMTGWIVSVAYPLGALVLSAVGALAVTR